MRRRAGGSGVFSAWGRAGLKGAAPGGEEGGAGGAGVATLPPQSAALAAAYGVTDRTPFRRYSFALLLPLNSF